MSRQRGQAAVLAFLLMGAVVIAGLMLFTSGQRAGSRMMLQNAADAGAYSASQIEARNLNFSAYMNRAIIANQVALGQFVSLMSWARYIVSVGTGLETLGALLDAPTLGISSAALDPVAAVYDSVGGAAESVVGTVYKGLGPVIEALNQVYSRAAQAYHYVTVYLVLASVSKVIRANDPAASLSTFGYAALLAHEYSYLKKFAPWQSASQTSVGGTGRMAATVEASRDPFMRQRGQTFHLPMTFNFGLSKILSVLHLGFLQSFASGFFNYKMTFKFNIDVGSRGGGEFRYVNAVQGNRFNWSGGDVAGVGFDGSLYLYFHFKGLKFGKITIIPSITKSKNFPITPASAPFSGASAQIGGSGNSLNPLDMSYYGGKVSSSMYGHAPGTYSSSWDLFTPAEISPSFGTKYGGLPGFVDVPPYSESQGFSAPYVLIGVTAPAPTPFISSGRFATPGGDAQNVLGALSKAEVYFSRPNDLSYFARSDGLTEQGNPYDPYWQARLVATTFNDRALALAGQQRQFWAPSLKKITSKMTQAKGDMCHLLHQAGLPC
jgi:hypothetical protein